MEGCTCRVEGCRIKGCRVEGCEIEGCKMEVWEIEGCTMERLKGWKLAITLSDNRRFSNKLVKRGKTIKTPHK